MKKNKTNNSLQVGNTLDSLKKPSHFALTILFTAIVFCIFTITMPIVGGMIFLLNQLGIISEISTKGIVLPITVFVLSSILMGTIVTTIISKFPLRPLQNLIDGMNRLANGDFSVSLGSGKNPIVRHITESFNLLAQELKNTEMLRSDFINNFSHEFKTPIVSIRGFAKLIQKGNIPEEQKHEYIDIIVEESERLAVMATNILNLTKVENQSILTDVTRFNLSEQIRNSILLLERKWEQKKLTIDADLEEVYIHGNEEMLKQVWINIIDNAIKFSFEQTEIHIATTQTSENISILVKNIGDEISDDDKKRIFKKFYQGDTSHASQGTGIGLSIVKRIVELHSGKITVNSLQNKTDFCVELPITQ